MTQSVYFIAHVDIKDFQAYLAEYGMPVKDLLEQAGAEILIGTPNAEVLEGEWPGNWTVLIKFENADAANSWYRSPAYEPLKKARIEKLSNGTTAVLAPAFDPVSLGL